MGIPRRLAHDDPYPGAAVTSRRQLLHPTVVERGGGPPAVLDEDLGELAPPAESVVEHPFDDRGVDEQCCP